MLLGITERLEFVDAPGYVEGFARYRARGHRMAGTRIRLVTDRPQSVIGVHPPSVNSGTMAGITEEDCSPGPLP